MTRQFVLRWGGYVQRVYRVPVGVFPSAEIDLSRVFSVNREEDE